MSFVRSPLARARALALGILSALVLSSSAAGAAEARLPADFVGMAADDVFYDPTPDYRNENLSAQRQSGVRLVRTQFTWEQIEKEPGVYDFSYHDAYVGALASHGIELLPTLSDAPDFYERPTGVRGFPPPTSNAKFAAFARALVLRYGPNGSFWDEHPELRRIPIRAWQIWNEPSLRVYWPPKPNVREYARMLKSVGGAIRRADRGAEIVTAGIPPSLLVGAVPYKKYIAGIYKYAGRSAFDTLAINAYARHAKDLDRLLTSVRELMDEKRDKKAPIWVTELGWADRGPSHRFVVGRSKQAKNLKESFAVMKKKQRKLRLRGLVYFSWRDQKPLAPDFVDQWGLHTGLLDRDGNRKPAYNAFIRAVRGLR